MVEVIETKRQGKVNMDCCFIILATIQFKKQFITSKKSKFAPNTNWAYSQKTTLCVYGQKSRDVYHCPI